MRSETKACIINAAWGAWYPQGQKRLVKSLIYHGFAWDILTWSNEEINSYFDPACPYTIKAAAIHEAVSKGYTHILWLDCSVWAVQNPAKIFDIICDDGGYFWKSGFNLCESANDYAIAWGDYTRDEAENIPELSTGMFGFNIEDPRGKKFCELFLKAARDKVFHGSRNHDGQSSDPRFKFHRQDQTAGTIAFHRAGFNKLHDPGIYSAYYDDVNNRKDSVIFLMQGM